MTRLVILSLLTWLFLPAHGQEWVVDSVDYQDLSPTCYRNHIYDVRFEYVSFDGGNSRMELQIRQTSTQGDTHVFMSISATEVDDTIPSYIGFQPYSNLIWVGDTAYVVGLTNPGKHRLYLIGIYNQQIVSVNRFPDMIPFYWIKLVGGKGGVAAFVENAGNLEMYLFQGGYLFFNHTFENTRAVHISDVDWTNNLVLLFRAELKSLESTLNLTVSDFSGYTIWDHTIQTDSFRLGYLNPMFWPSNSVSLLYSNPYYLTWKNPDYTISDLTTNYHSFYRLVGFDAFSGNQIRTTDLKPSLCRLNQDGNLVNLIYHQPTVVRDTLVIGYQLSTDLGLNLPCVAWVDSLHQVVNYKRFTELPGGLSNTDRLLNIFPSESGVAMAFTPTSGTNLFNTFLGISSEKCASANCTDGTCDDASFPNHLPRSFGAGMDCQERFCPPYFQSFRLRSSWFINEAPNGQPEVSASMVTIRGMRDDQVYFREPLRNLYRNIVFSGNTTSYRNMKADVCLPDFDQCYALSFDSLKTRKYRMDLILESDYYTYDVTSIDFPISDTFQLYIRNGQFSTTCEDQILSSTHVYPNPTSDQIVIDHPGSGLWSSFELYDLSGQKVHSGQFLNYTPSRLDVSKLRSGMYVLLIWDGEGVQSSKKIIKL
ncbi:MAG: T9SS type A sorting domain-containing protein [Bacteroidetes bacterium]|nr:T9SS type A sorting domain-containing protein [Bacteroidota bacterium]